MKTPIIILTKERPLQLKDMVDSIVAQTDKETYKIIICDNASTQPEMVAYLKSISDQHTIIRNKANEGFAGFNRALEKVNDEFFILSDPDIVLNPNMPPRWILRFKEVLKKVPVPKIGVALNIDFPVDTELTRRIRKRELEYWDGTMSVSDMEVPCYMAPIDTTLAMYRRDTYKFWRNDCLAFVPGEGIAGSKQIHQNQYNDKYYIPVLRIAGCFTCNHTGWDYDNRYAKDWEYYKDHCDKDLASTLNYLMKEG